MKKLITPITAENFPENWKTVDSERRTAKKKSVATRIASFFSNMVLTVMSLFAINGLIHDNFKGSYCDYLEEVPYLLPIWDKVSSYFLKPEHNWYIQILLTALVVYGSCFLVCGLFVLLVQILYHPRKRPLPNLTPKENASQMLAMARDARRFANRTGSRNHVFWALMFMIGQFALLSLYTVMREGTFERILQLLTSPIMKLLEPYMRNNMMRGGAEGALIMPALMISCLGMYLAYALIGLIHSLTVNFMYHYKVPYSFVAEVEYHSVFADEETCGMSQEEIETNRSDKAMQWLEQALEYEKICAYGKAKQLYAQSSHCGNPDAMEHYARHWLIANAKDPARYWLQKCVDTGHASDTAVKNLRRLKWHRKIQSKYLPQSLE